MAKASRSRVVGMASGKAANKASKSAKAAPPKAAKKKSSGGSKTFAGDYAHAQSGIKRPNRPKY